MKNPLIEIRHLPEWSWGRVLSLQVVLSLISGIVSSVATLEFSTWRLAQGIFFFPFISTLVGIILASFFYYYFQVFEKRTVSFVKLATLVFLANTVFYLFHALAGLLVFFDILGMAFTGFLLVIGLTDNFNLSKGRSMRLVAALFSLIFAVWVFEKLHDARLSKAVDSGHMEDSL